MSSYAIITSVGRNKEAAALAGGSALNVTHLAWGDGDRAPSGGEVALLNEVGRKVVQSNGVVSEVSNAVFFDIFLEAEEGPYIIREAGLFDADGDLIAIAKYDPPVNKPQDSVSALLRIIVVFSDLENLVLTVQGTDAFVPAGRFINAGAGLTGGGDLTADRNFALDFASEPEAVAGVLATKPVSPATVAAQIVSALDALASGAPAALDTLVELAAALGDDQDFAATMVAALAGKVDSHAGEITQQLTVSAEVGENAHIYFRDSAAQKRMLLFWNQATKNIVLQRYDDNEVVESDLVIDDTGLKVNGSYVLVKADLATQSEAENGANSTKVMTPLRTAQAIEKMQSNALPTAWVNFNGEGTVAILEAHNVSSITDLGTGNYRVNFATAMANTNYGFFPFSGNAVTSGEERTFGYLSSKTTTYVEFFTTNVHGNLGDWADISVLIMGGQ